MKLLNKTLSIIFIGIIILSSTSCKKDKNESDLSDVTAKLINKNWKLTAVSVSPAYAGTNNLFFKAHLDDCSKDNLYAFFADGYFYFNEAATKCNVSDVDRIDGGWHYEDNSSKLQFAIPPPTGGISDVYFFNISTLTDTQLTGTMSHTIDGVDYSGNWTFTKE